MSTKFQKKVYPVRKNRKKLGKKKIPKFSNGVYRVVKYWIPVLVWAGIIFLLSSIPNLKSGLEQDLILRKIAHIVEYAILTFFLFRALRPEADQFKPGRKEKRAFIKALMLAVIIAFLYALSDEYHQTFIFGRKGKLEDVGIDSIGILLTGLIWYYKNRKVENKSNF